MAHVDEGRCDNGSQSQLGLACRHLHDLQRVHEVVDQVRRRQQVVLQQHLRHTPGSTAKATKIIGWQAIKAGSGRQKLSKMPSSSALDPTQPR